MKKNITESFNSVFDFVSALSTRQQNKIITYKESTAGSKKFTGTDSFDAADELIKTGDEKNAKKLVQAMEEIKTNKEPVAKSLFSSVAGFAPIVPNYINGVPNNMLSQRRTRQAAAVANIFVNVATSFNVKTHEIINASAKIASIILALEAKKIKCNLFACMISQGTSEIINVAVKIKDSKAPLNRLNIAYPLINPSFLRRHMFKYIETLPELTDAYFNGTYGLPISLKDDNELLKNHKGKNIIFNLKDIIRYNKTTAEIIKDINL